MSLDSNDIFPFLTNINHTKLYLLLKCVIQVFYTKENLVSYIEQNVSISHSQTNYLELFSHVIYMFSWKVPYNNKLPTNKNIMTFKKSNCK